jgi:hypothetical protein
VHMRKPANLEARARGSTQHERNGNVYLQHD